MQRFDEVHIRSQAQEFEQRIPAKAFIECDREKLLAAKAGVEEKRPKTYPDAISESPAQDENDNLTRSQSPPYRAGV